MGLLEKDAATYYSMEDYGNYQFTSLDHIITQFQIGYVGEGKIIPKIKRADIQFFAMRALQELSFDTFKSVKSEETELVNRILSYAGIAIQRPEITQSAANIELSKIQQEKS